MDTTQQDVPRDAQAVSLRSTGKSFAAIARELGYDRPTEAVEAFNRELRRRPEPERDNLRDEELVRLDALAVRTHERTKDQAELAKRLRAIEGMRRRLLAP
jgi:hypothetical protein